MDLRKTVADILGGSSDKRIDEVTRILNDGGVGRADDLKNFNWNSLKELGGLSNINIYKIMRYIQENFPDEFEEHKTKRKEESSRISKKMDLRKTVADIFGGSSDKRIDEVTRILNDGGISRADDLKNFNWNSLRELGGLSKMDINRIMRYVQENFPDEYKEHKRKWNEERKLQNEADILKCKDDHERKLQEMKIRFEEEKEARVKEQRELEEEFTRSRQDQQNSSKKTGTTSEGVSHGFSKKCEEITRMPWSFGKKDKETVEEVISKILKGCDETRIATVASLLSGRGARTAEDIKQYNSEILKSIEGLSDEERNKIMKFIGKSSHEGHEKHKQTKNKLQAPEIPPNYKAESFKQNQSRAEFPKDHEKQMKKKDGSTQTKEYKGGELKALDPSKMSIEEVVIKIFRDSEPSTIKPLTSAMKNSGIKMAVELKYFESESFEEMDLDDTKINKIMAFVQENFSENNTNYKKRKYEETKAPKRPSGFETLAIQQQEQPWTDVLKIGETISEIFQDFSQTRITFVVNALKNHGIKTVKELKQFDEKPMKDMGLLDIEVNKIMDYLRKKFPKNNEEKKRNENPEEDFKSIDEDTQITSMNSDTLKSEPISSFMKNDDVNMLDELKKVERKLQQMDITEFEKIMEFLEKVKQNREKKTKAVEMQGKQSSSQAEATELLQKKDELGRNKSEVQVQTTEIQLQKVKKSQDFQGRDLNDPQKELQKSISNNHKGKDQFKDSNSNTSNDRQQKSDDTQLQQEQPDCHAEVIVKTDKLANSSNNINTSKDKSKKKDGSNQYFNSTRSTSV